MIRLIFWVALVATIGARAICLATDVGDTCKPGDPAPHDGLICKPAFVEEEGSLYPEWTWDPPQILNAQKGDSVLTADCSLIRNLLRQVDPPQDYSHSGIMLEGRYTIRSSTAADGRYGEYAGTDGVRKDVLRYGWPGTLTQAVEHAFEGRWYSSPESGQAYKITPFNNEPKDCLSGLAPSVVLTIPDELDVPTDTQNYRRPLLWAAADNAATLNGYYRFSAYSDAPAAYSKADIEPSEPSAWANDTYGTVCTSFILESLRNAVAFGAGLIMPSVEGGQLESTDVGADISSCNAADGYYCYSEAERLDAGNWLYQTFYDAAYEEAGFWGNAFTGVADDLANQVVNCFGFDWCGTEVPPEECGIPGPQTEYDAKDSTCWQNPGVGQAVAPDDMMLFWDSAPDGPYGKKHDLVLEPGRWVRTYRWEAAPGTGTVFGTVFGAGGSQPVEDAIVEIEGGNNVGLTAQITGPDGKYKIVGVPAPLNWGLEVCKDEVIGKFLPFFIAQNENKEINPVLNESCDESVSVSDWHRQVEIHGYLYILDDETPPAAVDEHGNFYFDTALLVNPDTPQNVFSTSECEGDEVRAEISLIANFNSTDRSVDLVADGKLYEGTDCNTDDHDGSGAVVVTFPPGSSGTLNLKVVNEEWDDGSYYTLAVTVSNNKAPPQ